jgi:hypothetical protein
MFVVTKEPIGKKRLKDLNQYLKLSLRYYSIVLFLFLSPSKKREGGERMILKVSGCDLSIKYC